MMDYQSEFEKFYETILQSIDHKKVPSLDDGLTQLIQEGDPKDFPESSYARIMISSWIEFLNQLFIQSGTESLLSNLNNHLSFIKRVDQTSRDFHLHYFRVISDRLFQYLLRNRILPGSHYDNEEDMHTYELDTYLMDEKFPLTDLVFHILKKNYVEINQTTENHIREILRYLQESNEASVKNHFSQLRAIQETILTILQLDRKEQKSPIVRKLKKEFELINMFYFLLRKISEKKRYHFIANTDFEFKTTYDYPFLDVLKTLGKWYQGGEEQFLKNAREIVVYISSKNPFRREDKEFLNIVATLVALTDVYQEWQKCDEIPALANLLEMLNQEKVPFPAKKVVIDFLGSIQNYLVDVDQQVERVLQFFFKLFTDQSITLIYRRKLFISIAWMIQAWLRSGFIPVEKSRKIATEMGQIDALLKKQVLKKMGEFKNLTYQLPLPLMLAEFERGLATHLLFALEDFTEWSDGRALRARLAAASLKQDARYAICEKLYQIAEKIISRDPDDSEVPLIKDETVKEFLQQILENWFTSLSELQKYFYGALIIHLLNLACDSGKLSEQDRQSLMENLQHLNNSGKPPINFPLSQHSLSQVFNEAYEKEFSALINLFYLFIPVQFLPTAPRSKIDLG